MCGTPMSISVFENLDLHLRGIVNGTTLRALPTHSWVGNCVSNRMGKCVGQSKQIDTIDDITDANFTLTATKDDETTRTKEHRSGHRDFLDIGIATEMSREAALLGSCMQVPVDLGYAVTIHKGQGLTIRKVHALLEGLFAHGQLYVQNSRTPFQRHFACIGVPPRDLLIPILQRVIQQQRHIFPRIAMANQQLGT